MQQQSYKWPIILFTIGVFMAGLDNGIISAALTTIYQSFEVSPTWGAWAITLYTLGLAISVPIIGKLSDRYGRKKLFLIEIFLFGLGSLLVALSPTFTMLLIARFIQAIGGGGIFIIGSTYVLTTVPKEHQGKFLGLLGSMHGLSAVVGPNAGALILHLTGKWEWMFFINVPIAIFLFCMGLWKMDEQKRTSEGRLDVIGAAYLSLFILFIMLGLTNLDPQAWVHSILSIAVLPYFVAAFILGVAFLRHEYRVEARGEDPIIATSTLRHVPFIGTLFLGILSGGFLATIVFIPSYVEQVLQVPVESAAFWVTPVAIASGIGSGLGGFLTDKIGPKKTIMLSGIIGFTGFLLFYQFVDNMFMFVIASMFAGIGLGFLLGAPLNVLMSVTVVEEEYGSSLGTLSLMRQMGMTIFPMVFASFVTSSVKQLGTDIQSVTASTFSIPAGNDDALYGIIMEKIGHMQAGQEKETLLQFVANTMEIGFGHMFLTTMVLATVVSIIGFIFLKFHKQ